MSSFIESIIEISCIAGDAILKFYNEEISFEQKADQSPLTWADLAAHQIISETLGNKYPEIPMISEEGGISDFHQRKNWTRFWLIDPLDGTKEFIKKNGEFTVNIALIEDGVPVFGVVHVPAQGVTYWGKEGNGSFKIDENGISTQIFSKIPDLNKPLTVVSSRSHGSDNLEEILHRLGIRVGEKIPAGSSLKFCLVAEGSADLYPRLGPTMEWDTAAGDAVYRYSGKEYVRYSPLIYNKTDLKNGSFIIGLDQTVEKL